MKKVNRIIILFFMVIVISKAYSCDCGKSMYLDTLFSNSLELSSDIMLVSISNITDTNYSILVLETFKGKSQRGQLITAYYTSDCQRSLSNGLWLFYGTESNGLISMLDCGASRSIVNPKLMNVKDFSGLYFPKPDSQDSLMDELQTRISLLEARNAVLIELEKLRAFSKNENMGFSNIHICYFALFQGLLFILFIFIYFVRIKLKTRNLK